VILAVAVAVAVAVLLLARGSGVTLPAIAWPRIVPWLVLTVTLIWMRQVPPVLSLPRWHLAVAPRAPALGLEHCPLAATAMASVRPHGHERGGRWAPARDAGGAAVGQVVLHSPQRGECACQACGQQEGGQPWRYGGWLVDQVQAECCGDVGGGAHEEQLSKVQAQAHPRGPAPKGR